MEETLTTPAPAEITWSKSQIATYRDCLRKAFFSYHLDSDGEHKRLKSLGNRFLWTGATLHTAVGSLLKLLRQGTPIPSIDDFLTTTRDGMRAAYKDSSANPTSVSRLFEHEYAKPILPEMWAQHWQTVERSIRWFYESKWLTRFKELGPENWKSVDEVLGFHVEGVKSYVKIDCGLEIDGTFHIIDWKSSTPKPTDDLGLQVAGLYATEVWGADPSQVSARAVSLLDGQTRTVEINEDVLVDTSLRIADEASYILKMAENFGDDPSVVPGPQNRRTCTFCNYQRLCYPEGLEY